MDITSRILEDGSKNFKVLITGVLFADIGPTVAVDLKKMNPIPSRGVKLEDAVWVVQEKLGIILWWGQGEVDELPAPPVNSENFLLVMESRNSLRYDHGLNSPRANEKWDKRLWMRTFGFDVPASVGVVHRPKHFSFVLNMDKQ